MLDCGVVFNMTELLMVMCDVGVLRFVEGFDELWYLSDA